MYFHLNTEQISCNIETVDKYVLIDGFSGVGKSFMVLEIERLLRNHDNRLTMSNHVIVISSEDNIRNINADIKDYGTVIYVVDEFYAHDVLVASLNKNVYVIAITRKIYKDINMSYRCLYNAKRNNNTGVTEVINTVKVCTTFPLSHYDYIVIEDSGSGYNYISSVCTGCNIISSYGKRNMYSIIGRLKDYNSLLIILDGGGCADVIIKICTKISKLRDKGKQVRLLVPECFEHILLVSSFIGIRDILSVFKPCMNNTESMCRDLISDITNGKPYEYKHDYGILSECWIKECDSCDNCTYALKGNKKELVLSNGPASALLEIKD